MKQKIKKIFENAVWWSGVITVGIVLGISLQIVKAWTEPTTAPPGGNVGAPINTSDVGQTKWGALQVLGFTLFNDADLNDDGIIDNDVTGKVLTAQNANGATAWAGGGGIYTNWGFNTCVGSDTKIYDGEAIFPADGNGKGGVICLNGHLKDWPTSSSTTGTYWQNGKENAPAGSGSYDWAIVKCAVCTK